MENRGPSPNTLFGRCLEGEAETSRGDAAGVGTGAPAAGTAGDWVRTDGNQPARRVRASRLDAIPDRQCHHQAPNPIAEAAGPRRVARDRSPGCHFLRSHAIAFQGGAAADYGVAAKSAISCRQVVGLV